MSTPLKEKNIPIVRTRDWHPVLRFPLEQNLLPLLNHLQAQGIVCRATEESGQQQLWVADAAQIHGVAESASRWVAGELSLESVTASTAATTVGVSKSLVALHLLRLLPLTLVLNVLAWLGIALFLLEPVQLTYLRPLLFQKIQGGAFLPPAQTLAQGEYWRLLSPTLLHFSFLHVLFNTLFIWVIGRRIELAKGTLHYLTVAVLIGLAANVAQYMVQANTVFGGLSGLVYGVIGYIAVYQRYIQHPILQFQPSMIVMFIVMLLLGVFGVVDWFIDGRVANAAHIAGLVSGALIGGVVAFGDRRRLFSDQ